MVLLNELWLPILLSAVLVFVVSAVVHMAAPWHMKDYPPLPNESAFRAATRSLAIPPGDYMVPRTFDRTEMKSAEFTARTNEGPNMILTVLPNGPWTMGRNLSLWFVYLIAVSVLAAYIGGRALGPGANYLDVFRFVGTTSFAAFSFALWQQSIWFHRAWSMTIKETFDGLIYSLLMAGVFGWLWPK